MNFTEVCSTSPLQGDDSPFLPYQRAWLQDKSRFKIGLWARQTGKDYTCAAEAIFDAQENPASTWLIVAAGERQALESLQKAKEWAGATDTIIASASEFRDRSTSILSSAEITLANHSRIIALPARPETVRGYSANLILTEFAFHDNPAEIWRALYPSISNPLRGGQKKLRIISTPNGPGDKFHQLWTKSDYSKHLITIHHAVAQGLDIDIDQLRNGLNDPDGWAQEYECQFLDAGAVLLPYDLIQSCEDFAATEFNHPGPRGHLVCGIDFGRKHDRTVCWTLERVGDVLWTREVLVLDKMPTPDQVELLRPRLAAARKICLDYTGPGVGLGDYLAKDFGLFDPSQHRYGKIEPCQFTPQLKNELLSKLRIAFETKKLRIPPTPSIREDLHALRRVISANGTITYKATASQDGHSDRATALALALRAAGDPRPAPASSAVLLPERMRPRAHRKHSKRPFNHSFISSWTI